MIVTDSLSSTAANLKETFSCWKNSIDTERVEQGKSRRKEFNKKSFFIFSPFCAVSSSMGFSRAVLCTIKPWLAREKETGKGKRFIKMCCSRAYRLAAKCDAGKRFGNIFPISFHRRERNRCENFSSNDSCFYRLLGRRTKRKNRELLANPRWLRMFVMFQYFSTTFVSKGFLILNLNPRLSSFFSKR